MLVVNAVGSRQWVMGLNKYAHDAGCALLSIDGQHSIIVPNERVGARRKHDGGDVSLAVQHALSSVGATLDDVVIACSNNHHHRIAQFERRLPWSVDLGLYPSTALNLHNLLPASIPRHEMSHHLAHAWSAIAQAPFERGVVVVMDGMGELHSAMEVAEAEAELTYHHDGQLGAGHTFVQVPSTLKPTAIYREAETAYCFDGREVCH